MIRRAPAGLWLSAETSPSPAAVDALPQHAVADARDEGLETAMAQAYERGWDDGRTALAKEEAARHASEADRVERAERSLADSRASLVALLDGLNDALASHAATMETAAVDIALEATAALVRPLIMDASVVAAMCAQLMDSDGADATSVLEVSPLDRSSLPESIRGVRIVAVEGVRRGRCILRGSRGSTHGDILERLEALAEAFSELVNAPSP